MAVFNRVYCPGCKKGHNIYDENLKNIDCSCGVQVTIKARRRISLLIIVYLMGDVVVKDWFQQKISRECFK